MCRCGVLPGLAASPDAQASTRSSSFHALHRDLAPGTPHFATHRTQDNTEQYKMGIVEKVNLPHVHQWRGWLRVRLYLDQGDRG